jgi:Tol biopolymer transport system component
MGLAPGTRLGAYEVTAQIGEGGMGQVFRATDTKLKRQVALKILPPSLAADPERLARFQREAEVLASLNHPHIAGIYGLEEGGGLTALVMELVEGEDLSQRIARGPIPLDEALPIVKQIAEALEAAHEQGIVHRDLKPANIKVRPDGTVKVLDFGLAKALEPAAVASGHMSMAPTITTPAMTQAGIILGTAAYMSPEQARGKPVDRRADIWAFGCVLAEMLSGRQTFTGETVSDVMAAILTRDVDWDTLSGVPGKVRELIARCLQRDPIRRLRDIGDARILLDEALTAPVEAPPRRLPANRRLTLAWLLAVFVAFATGLGVMWVGSGRTTARPAWSGTKVGGAELAFQPRVQPNGSLVAFLTMVNGLTQVAVMQPESGDWRVVTEDRTQGYTGCGLSWSPDERIYYDRWYGVPRGVFSVQALGGAERLVVENAACPEALPDGSLLVVQINEKRQNQLYRHWPGTDRRPRAYPAIFPNSTPLVAARAFRDGSEAVFWGRSTDQPESDPCVHLYVLDLASGSVEVVRTDASLPCQAIDRVMLAVGADDRSILVSSPRGSLRTLVAIPRRGGRATELISMTSEISGIDVARNGDLYVDQVPRPMEIVSMDPDGAQPHTILISDSYVNVPGAVMPDGSVLFTSLAGGRKRVLAARPGQAPAPFIQTAEETSGPITMVGKADVAFLIGSTARQLALSSHDGRNLRRLEQAHGSSITSLAASPDGQTLYYAASGIIWAIGVSGGEPSRIEAGDSVAVDPRGSLIVQFTERDNSGLKRVPLSGGQGQGLSFPDIRLTPTPITSNAVRADGAIIKNISTSDSWLWLPVILFPDTGKVQRIPLSSFLDVHHVTWTPDGKVLVLGLQTHGSIWRLRPASGN